MDIFEWDESIPVTANNLNEMQNILNDNITNSIQSDSGYIKYSDGTMICYGNGQSTSSGFKTITFPVAFISTPSITAQSYGSAETSTVATAKMVSPTSTQFKLAVVYSSGYLQNYFCWIAIGKWK